VEIFIICIQKIYYKPVSDRIWKIGQHLPKLLSDINGTVFVIGAPCLIFIRLVYKGAEEHVRQINNKVFSFHKFGRGLSRLLHTELHWLDVLEPVIQTQRHGVQLPARSSASVPRGIMPTSRRCLITATSSICHPYSS